MNEGTTRFEEVKEAAVEELRAHLKAECDSFFFRYAICALVPRLEGSSFNVDLTPILDSFAQRNGLQPLGADWSQVDKDTADWILCQALAKDLAYRAPRSGASDAGSRVQMFMDLCVPEDVKTDRHRFYSNGKGVDGPTMVDLDGNKMLGAMNATDAEFDTGVVMVTRSRIGLLWVGDND